VTEGRAQSSRSYRRVAAAVDAVCAVAADFDATTLDEVVLAISAERRRPIEIATSDQLGPGVCGQRRSFPDRDVIVLAKALPAREHTLAHELGHIIFEHPGEPAADVVLEAGDDLVAYMLSQRAHQRIVDDGEDEQCEWEAETFASMLMTRLRVFNNRGAGVSVLRFDEALG
jgi:hypothetical protein